MSRQRDARRHSTAPLRILTGLLLALAALATGLAWAHLTPPGASPDDDYHTASLYCPPPLAQSGCEPTQVTEGGKVHQGVLIPVNVANIGCYVHIPTASADCLKDFSGVPVAPTFRVDNGDYPGPYYRILSKVYRTGDLFSGTLRVRATTVVLAVGLLGAIALVGTAGTRRLLTYSLLASIVPLGLFVMTSVNPSSWAVIGVAGAAAATYSLFNVAQRWRAVANAALLVASATVAAVARTDAGPYLWATTGAVALLCVRRALWRWWRALALLPAWAVGWWSFRTGASAAAASSSTPITDIPTYNVLFLDLVDLPRLLFGIYGFFGLGWFEYQVPGVTTVASIIVVGAVLLLGLRSVSWSKAAAWLALAGVLVLLPLYMLVKDHIMVGSYVQPRYFLPLVPPLLMITVVARDTRRVIALSRRKTAAVHVALAAGHAAALWIVARRYLFGDHPHRPLWFAGSPRWWWEGAWSPGVWWWIGVVGFTVLLGALWAVQPRRRWHGGAHAADEPLVG